MEFLLQFHDDVDEREYRLKMYLPPLQIHNVVGFTRGSVRTAMQRLSNGCYVRKHPDCGMYQTDEKLYDKYIQDSKTFVRKKPIPIHPRNQYMKLSTSGTTLEVRYPRVLNRKERVNN